MIVMQNRKHLTDFDEPEIYCQGQRYEYFS